VIGYEIRCGDSMLLLRDLPDGHVDAVICDPPYSSGGAMRGDRVRSTTEKYVSSNLEREDFEGDTRDQRGFLAWAGLWMAECYRVTKPGGVIAAFIDWRMLPTITDAMQVGGWVWRGVAVWDKTEAVRPVIGRFRSQCEYIVWGSRGPMSTDRGVPAIPGCLRCSRGADARDHIAQKPVEVMLWVVRLAVPGGLVLDPFAGTGTTGVACLREGRRFLGFEMVPSWAEHAQKRLAAESEGSSMSAARAGQLPLLGET
jgi:site-specific DNA-methyltransferase (adenine-specific)